MVIQLGAGGGCSPFHLLILFGLLEPQGLPESEEVAHTAGTPKPGVWVLFTVATPLSSPAGTKAGSFQGRLYHMLEQFNSSVASKERGPTPPLSPCSPHFPCSPCGHHCCL